MWTPKQQQQQQQQQRLSVRFETCCSKREHPGLMGAQNVPHIVSPHITLLLSSSVSGV
jgi:hypothetical protein